MNNRRFDFGFGSYILHRPRDREIAPFTGKFSPSTKRPGYVLMVLGDYLLVNVNFILPVKGENLLVNRPGEDLLLPGEFHKETRT